MGWRVINSPESALPWGSNSNGHHWWSGTPSPFPWNCQLICMVILKILLSSALSFPTLEVCSTEVLAIPSRALTQRVETIQGLPCKNYLNSSAMLSSHVCP